MKRISKYFFSFLAFAILWSILMLLGTLNGWWHKPLADSTEPTAFVSGVNSEIEKQFVGNLALALIKNWEVEKELFYSSGKSVDRNTVFQVSSLSKFVSATGVMKLNEMGMIDLDAPISQYLTRWQLPPSEFDNEKVTVRRLLSHTAGLVDGLGYSGFEDPNAVQPLEESLTKALDADEGLSGEVKVGMEPDSGWKYSGGGYTLLQLLVEETSGQSFNDFMKDHIFEPLNMHQTSYILNDSLETKLCEFYNADGTLAPHFYYTSLAATSLYTSLADLETFFQIFDTNNTVEAINPNTLLSMQEPHFDMMGMGIYGLGTMLYVNIDDSNFIIGHDGQSTPPINTAIRINPISGDGIIVLETGHSNMATRIASDWVFLKTNKVDTLLFMTNQAKMISLIKYGLGIGGLLITGMGLWRKRKE